MFKSITDIFIHPDTKIMDALKVLNHSGIGCVFVVDEENRLLGTITDGDVRRALMKGTSLDGTVDNVMNQHPVTAPLKTPRKELIAMMTLRNKRQIPLVDEEKRVVDVFWEKNIAERLAAPSKTTPVVIMCGGKGTRLRPLTESVPKPMLPVGDTPIIEHIIKSLSEYGFQDILLAVNYHSDVIEEYCGTGSKWGVKIDYIRERDYLGTAGSLGNISHKIIEPVLVMNGDLMVGIDFGKLMNFHIQGQYEFTVGVKPYKIQIPYGIVGVAGQQVTNLEEKPVIPFLTNAGIYVINPEVLSLIPKNIYFDMPQLIQKVLSSNGQVGAFPFHEYWLDVGRPQDYHQASEDVNGGLEQSRTYLSNVKFPVEFL